MTKFYLDRTKINVPSNPTLDFAKEILKKAKGSKEIISKGGGSTIDVGKYVAWKLNIKHTAIPTTAGTGSEVTKYAVFIDKGKKVSYEDDALIPEDYILNPELIVSLPPLHTASSGLDALSQAVESYWSPVATATSKLYAKRAIRKVMSSLYLSFKYPKNEILRMKMLQGANLSGKAINITRTSVCHALSYPLTIKYRIPHGIACASTLPIFMRVFKFDVVPVKKVERLIKSLGIDIKDIQEKITSETIEDLNPERVNNVPFKINIKKELGL